MKYNGLEPRLVADSAPSPGWSSDERIALEFTVYTLEVDIWLWDSGGALDQHRHALGLGRSRAMALPSW